MQGTPPESDKKAFFCAAFPNGVPIEILEQGHDHLEPFSGDNGITFEQAKDVDLGDINYQRKQLGLKPYTA
ncbi:MAG: hypothetical protein DRR08_20180 [Candidatus Parabeggiatoa sp. nov. 2]|nr:MAG: hypothetical protein B6247_20245 [Beggiatoa sp. 4572_84]RKZ56989.1 MAG: hypothetical protein DRR08_20180 [Gammaproteobacteria bacterium]